MSPVIPNGTQNWSRGFGDAAGRNKGQHTDMQVKKEIFGSP
jgi:hypothetical protein